MVSIEKIGVLSENKQSHSKNINNIKILKINTHVKYSSNFAHFFISNSKLQAMPFRLEDFTCVRNAENSRSMDTLSAHIRMPDSACKTQNQKFKSIDSTPMTGI